MSAASQRTHTSVTLLDAVALQAQRGRTRRRLAALRGRAAPRARCIARASRRIATRGEDPPLDVGARPASSRTSIRSPASTGTCAERERLARAARCSRRSARRRRSGAAPPTPRSEDRPRIVGAPGGPSSSSRARSHERRCRTARAVGCPRDRSGRRDPARAGGGSRRRRGRRRHAPPSQYSHTSAGPSVSRGSSTMSKKKPELVDGQRLVEAEVERRA